MFSRAIFVFTMAFGVSAQAQTYFDTLQGWFAGGVITSYAATRGFYSGRCFQSLEPSVPRNSLLGYLEYGNRQDPGPGLPPNATDARMNMVIARGRPADIFDDPRLYPQNRQTFERLTAQIWPTLSPPSDSPTLNFAVDWEPNGNPDVLVEYMYYQNYVVSRATALISQRYANAWTGQPFYARAGDVLTMCYYFQLLGR
jgi:hypothetical protein